MKDKLLITLDYPPAFGGVSDYYSQLVRYFPDGELAVLDNNSGQLWQPQKGFLKWFKMLKAVARACRVGGYRKILVGQVIPLGWAAYILSFWFKFDYGVFLHGLDLSLALKTPRRRLGTKMILRRARWIICANSYTAKQVKKFLDQRFQTKIFIVNPGIDPTSLPSLETLNAQKLNLAGNPKLLTVGRLVKRKGIDKMLQILPEILLKYPKLKYYVLGQGPELENLKLQAQDLGLKDCVQFASGVAHMQKWLYYQECDLFILPALDLAGDYEGFGIVYLESALLGKPVVAGLSGGVKDAVVNEQTGLIVDVLQTQELKEAVLKLLDDQKLSQKMGQVARARVLENFTWEKQASKIAEILLK